MTENNFESHPEKPKIRKAAEEAKRVVVDRVEDAAEAGIGTYYKAEEAIDKIAKGISETREGIEKGLSKTKAAKVVRKAVEDKASWIPETGEEVKIGARMLKKDLSEKRMTRIARGLLSGIDHNLRTFLGGKEEKARKGIEGKAEDLVLRQEKKRFEEEEKEDIKARIKEAESTRPFERYVKPGGRRDALILAYMEALDIPNGLPFFSNTYREAKKYTQTTHIPEMAGKLSGSIRDLYRKSGIDENYSPVVDIFALGSFEIEHAREKKILSDFNEVKMRLANQFVGDYDLARERLEEYRLEAYKKLTGEKLSKKKVRQIVLRLYSQQEEVEKTFKEKAACLPHPTDVIGIKEISEGWIGDERKKEFNQLPLERRDMLTKETAQRVAKNLRMQERQGLLQKVVFLTAQQRREMFRGLAGAEYNLRILENKIWEAIKKDPQKLKSLYSSLGELVGQKNLLTERLFDELSSDEKLFMTGEKAKVKISRTLKSTGKRAVSTAKETGGEILLGARMISKDLGRKAEDTTVAFERKAFEREKKKKVKERVKKSAEEEPNYVETGERRKALMKAYIKALNTENALPYFSNVYKAAKEHAERPGDPQEMNKLAGLLREMLRVSGVDEDYMPAVYTRGMDENEKDGAVSAKIMRDFKDLEERLADYFVRDFVSASEALKRYKTNIFYELTGRESPGNVRKIVSELVALGNVRKIVSELVALQEKTEYLYQEKIAFLGESGDSIASMRDKPEPWWGREKEGFFDELSPERKEEEIRVAVSDVKIWLYERSKTKLLSKIESLDPEEEIELFEPLARTYYELEGLKEYLWEVINNNPEEIKSVHPFIKNLIGQKEEQTVNIYRMLRKDKTPKGELSSTASERQTREAERGNEKLILGDIKGLWGEFKELRKEAMDIFGIKGPEKDKERALYNNRYDMILWEIQERLQLLNDYMNRKLSPDESRDSGEDFSLYKKLAAKIATLSGLDRRGRYDDLTAETEKKKGQLEEHSPRRDRASPIERRIKYLEEYDKLLRNRLGVFNKLVDRYGNKEYVEMEERQVQEETPSDTASPGEQPESGGSERPWEFIGR